LPSKLKINKIFILLKILFFRADWEKEKIEISRDGNSRKRMYLECIKCDFLFICI
jgi:hypothetical protein